MPWLNHSLDTPANNFSIYNSIYKKELLFEKDSHLKSESKYQIRVLKFSSFTYNFIYLSTMEANPTKSQIKSVKISFLEYLSL